MDLDSTLIKFWQVNSVFQRNGISYAQEDFGVERKSQRRSRKKDKKLIHLLITVTVKTKKLKILMILKIFQKF